MAPIIIAFAVGIVGGWIHAGFPLPRWRAWSCRSGPSPGNRR